MKEQQNIESWGRGTLKILKECEAAGLPQPIFYYEKTGLWVEFRKDIYNEKYLKSLGLSDRQVKGVLLVKVKGKITNSEYQKLNDVSKRTATNELTQLAEDFKLLKKSGIHGAGISYKLIGQ